MSAETPTRSRSQSRGVGPPTVTPQQVTDPTILDSVAGFINDVVPTAYSTPCEVDDKIQWAHFEQLEYDESSFDGDNVIPPPLILVLGYSSGIQIWAVPATGEASEILSWRHSCFRVLRFIPTPFKTGSAEAVDCFASARPLIALCDSTANYSTITFRSLKAGVVDPVKQIKFKTSVLNVLANRHSVVVSFPEKIAVFDAFTLETRVSITTCYLSPGLQPNPIALGARWLAYAEKKQINANRSGGGNEGEGVQSYTATVLHAAKSLGRGLRELTETVAGSLTGNPNFKPGTSPNSPQAGGMTDVPQKGVITILDIENKNINPQDNIIPQDAVIAHFVAHTEAVVCLSFDPTGMLLLTADKRGHDFHVFRIQPHPAGPALAAVHHLYILHRGDTSAKVQDMCFSPDSRWVTVSTLRGTTHVFPVTPYGGNISVRTHATAHVVNKMSRYQRSAGLTSEGRSSSPVTFMEAPVSSLFPYRNPRFPPYPQPTVVHPLAQIRQPVYAQTTGSAPPRTHSGRQRLTSSSEENISLKVVACFAPPRAWMDATTKLPRETTHKQPTKPVESLFSMSCYGTLVQYDLEPHPSSSVPRDRVSNDTPIELRVCAKAQWVLHRRPNEADLPLPMSEEHLGFIAQTVPLYKKSKPDHNDEHWLSQVEIVTHLGPHRRLWMGPQFTFKTYTITNGAVLETKPVDVRRSKPVNMPVSKASAILIESGSASSCEQLFLDTYHRASDETGSAGELQLKEDLADAMLESPGIRDQGGHCVIVSMKPHATSKVVNPLGTVVTVQSDEEEQEAATVEDAVIHENCDEALFRPVVAPKAVFYADNRPKTCPPENILTKSLEANVEVAVRIVGKKDRETRNNRTLSSNKHIKPKSRESSPKSVRAKPRTENKPISKSSKAELNLIESRIGKAAQKSQKAKVCELPEPEFVPPPPLVDFDILLLQTETGMTDSLGFEFPPLVTERELRKRAESPLFQSISSKFEDDFNEKLITSGAKGESEIANSSEEEKVVTARKARKPKIKLGVKIAASNKDNPVLVDYPAEPPQPKRSWNMVAASKPPEKQVDDFPEPVEHFTFRLPKKESPNLIDIDDIDNETRAADRGGLKDSLKVDKSSDDEKADSGSSPAETTESDDSVPVIASVDMDDEAVAATQTMQSSAKGSKRRSKKKRK